MHRGVHLQATAVAERKEEKVSKKTWVIEFEYDENSINVHEVAIMHDLNSLKKIDGVKVTEVKNE